MQTAAQINVSQTGQVTILESPPAVTLGREQDQSLSLKLSRAKMIEAVKSARQLPLVYQEVLLAEIALIDPKHDLLRLDFVRHAHGVGANATWTVKEI